MLEALLYKEYDNKNNANGNVQDYNVHIAFVALY